LPPIVIRAEALEHLLAVARGGCEPNIAALSEEFVSKNDFRKWLIASGRPMPEFWFSPKERYPKAQQGIQHRTGLDGRPVN
jgi:hypothetical protein